MVKWENDKNVYILGAALRALDVTITNEIAQGILDDWPSELGEKTTLRGVKDQLKKLSPSPSTAASASTTTTAKKSGAAGAKKPKAATKGKGTAKGKGKGKKRALAESDEEEEVDEDAEEEEAMPLNKKQKVAAVKNEVEDEENNDEV